MDASPNRTRHRRSDRYGDETSSAPAPSDERPYYVPTPPPIYDDEEPAKPVSRAGGSVSGSPRRAARTVPGEDTSPRHTVPRPYNVPAPPPMYDEQQAKPAGRNTPAAPRRPVPPPMDAPAQEAAEQDRQRIPRQLTAATVAALLLALGLLAAQYLMMAYLKTQDDARAAAHQALLDYYHITERDGRLRVTYQDYIERYAWEYNLRPAFLTAVIRSESSFRTDAESDAGARGLMQLMPDTAAWIARKLGVSDFTFDSMYDAETNIRFGAWYLNYLSGLFRGDPILVVAAYHAGQTTVTQWLSDRSMSPDGYVIPLENLRDGPTKTYAGRVTQAYGIYQALLYPESPLADTAPADGVSDTHSAAPADAVPTSFIER